MSDSTFDRRGFLAAAAGLVIANTVRAGNGEDKPSGVAVLDGADVDPMRSALARLNIPFGEIGRLTAESVAGLTTLVISGTEPAAGPNGNDIVRRFVADGGSLLAVGGGAKWAIEAGLFDAKGYYPTGTTIHHTSFAAVHPLTFGYPEAEPKTGWVKGVPMLVRTTGGPLMTPGPAAASLLSYGDPYSAAALQPLGRGVMLLIGPDPQGGDMVYTLGKATPVTGDELGTDRLLANAVGYLCDRSMNLLDNAEFDRPLDPSIYSRTWSAETRRGGRWRQADGVIELECPGQESTANLQTPRRVAVEAGRDYRLRVRYRSTAPWAVRFTLTRGHKPNWTSERLDQVHALASADWADFTTDLKVPEGVGLVSFVLMLYTAGTLAVDAVTLKCLTS